MQPRLSRFHRKKSIIAGAALVLLLLAALGGAEETRHCSAQLCVIAQNASQAYLTYDFSVRRSVGALVLVNKARREARAVIIRCLRDHWAERAMPDLSRNCRDHYRVEVVNYPFYAIEDEVTADMCAANARSGPLCLLKRRAGMPVPDPCCRSGIKR